MKILKAFLLIIIFSLSPADFLYAQVFSSGTDEKRTALINNLKENHGIRDRKLLYSIDLIDRDIFIPEKFRKYTYTETSIPLAGGNTIPPVSEIAKALTMADTKEKQKVLIIGSHAGYAAALFSYFYDNVYLIETDQENKNTYPAILEEKYNNITAYYGYAPDAFQGYGPFDAIFIHGSVRTVEPVFFDILKSLGEIIFPLESPGGLQQIVKYKKVYSEISITSGGTSYFSSLR